MTFTVAIVGTFVFASLFHFVVDFCFQNEWMVNNKHNVKHPAGYVHAFLIALPMFLFFPAWAVATIGITHFLIDTRIPITVWMKLMRKNLPNEPWFLYVAITVDQIWHVSIIALLSIICSL